MHSQLQIILTQTAKAASLFLFCIVVYGLFQYLEIDFSFFAVFTEKYITQFGITGIFIFLLLSGIGTFFFVPRQLLSLVAGFFYGWKIAVVLVSLGAGIGCLLSMVYGSILAGEFFRKKIRRRIHCLESIFTKSTFGIALGIRIMPVGSNTMLNMIVGATKIPFWPFWTGSVLGYIPQNFLFAVLGHTGKTEQDITVYSYIFLYAALFVAGFFIVKKSLPGHVTLQYFYNGIIKGKK